MKNIKTYESFFKNIFKKKNSQEWIKNENIVNDVRETLLELTDNDEFSVSVGPVNTPDNWDYMLYSSSYPTPPKYNVILIIINKKIIKNWQSKRIYSIFNTFSMNDIKDTLEPAISYLDEVYGLKIDKIEYYVNSSRYYANPDKNTSAQKNIGNKLNSIDYNEQIENLKIFLK